MTAGNAAAFIAESPANLVPKRAGLKNKGFPGLGAGVGPGNTIHHGKTCPLSTTLFAPIRSSHCPCLTPMLGGPKHSGEAV